MNLKLRFYRESLGLTQPELAKMIGKSFRTVQSWEREESYPNAEAVWRLCELFNTDPNDLLGWNESHPVDVQDTLTKDERTLLVNYRQCTPRRREKAAEFVRDQRDLSKELEDRSSLNKEGAA